MVHCALCTGDAATATLQRRRRCCEFERIKGGKPFDVHSKWFKEMMVEIGQTSADAYPVGPS